MGTGSIYHGYIMGRGVKIPWVEGVNIPWIGVEYHMDKGFNILYIF